MKNTKIILILIVCLLSLGAVSCGSDESEDVENNETKVIDTFDVSTLITKEEAEEAIGLEVMEAEISEQAALGQKQCFYDGKELDIETGFVTVNILRTADMPEDVTSSGQSAITIYEDLKANDENPEEVEGLGDDAYWGTGGLYVLSGDIYFNVNVGNTDVPGNEEICIDLAEIILSRI